MEEKIIEEAFAIIEEVFGVTKKELQSKSRLREYNDARYVFSVMLHRKGVSTPHIGKALNRDHSTIIHYKKIFSNLYDMDKAYKEKSNRVFAAMKEVDTTPKEGWVRLCIQDGRWVVGHASKLYNTLEEAQNDNSFIRSKIYKITLGE